MGTPDKYITTDLFSCLPDGIYSLGIPERAVTIGWHMDLREMKGLELAARTRITFADGAWQVPSQVSPSTKYRVTLDPPTCSCDDWTLRREPCKHIHAARIVRERDGGPQVAIDTNAVPKRPTYPQNWPAYNLAQSVEK